MTKIKNEEEQRTANKGIETTDAKTDRSKQKKKNFHADKSSIKVPDIN